MKSIDQLKRPKTCIPILLMLIPILAVATTIETVTAACTCPYGGRYFESLHRSLCGWQYDVCVTFDYNCANDYPAVCGTTTTPTTCGYVEMMMGRCQYTQQRYTSQTTAATTRTTQRFTTTTPSGNLYTVTLVVAHVKLGLSVAGWSVYLDNKYVGQTDRYGKLTITNVSLGSHRFKFIQSGSLYVWYLIYTVNSNVQLTVSLT